MNVDELKNMIRELVSDELDEISVAGDIGVGAGPIKTPQAFTGGGAAGEASRKKSAEQFGFKIVNESLNMFNDPNEREYKGWELSKKDSAGRAIWHAHKQGIRLTGDSPEQLRKMIDLRAKDTTLNVREADEDPLGGEESFNKIDDKLAYRLMDVVNTYAEGISKKWMENAIGTARTSPDHFYEMAKASIPPTVIPKFREEFEKALGRPVQNPGDIKEEEDPLGGSPDSGGGDEESSNPDMEITPEDYDLDLSMQAQELITFLKSDGSMARAYQVIEDKFKQLKNPELKLVYAIFIPFVEKSQEQFIRKNNLDMSLDEYFMPSDKFKVAAFLGQELFDLYGKREDEEPEMDEPEELPEPESPETPPAGGGAPPAGGGGLPKPEDLKESGNRIDMTGKRCLQCKKGKYKETNIHDDWDGVVHCDKCNHQIDRWKTREKS